MMVTPSDPEFLQAMRVIGDPGADGVISLWVNDPQRCKDKKSLTSLANNLVGFDKAPELPELLELLRKSEGASNDAVEILRPVRTGMS